MGLALTRWQGIYKGVEAVWLRWATMSGELLPTSDDIAEQEKRRASQERRRAEQQRQRAELAQSQLKQVAVNLLQQGMTVEEQTLFKHLSQALHCTLTAKKSLSQGET